MDTRVRAKMPLLYVCYRLSVATALSASERCVKIIIDDSPDETILCLSHSKLLQLKADDQPSQMKKQKQNIKHSYQKTKQNCSFLICFHDFITHCNSGYEADIIKLCSLSFASGTFAFVWTNAQLL